MSFAAGEMKSFFIPGKYFRILSSLASTVDAEFFLNNLTVGEKAYAVDAGYYAVPENGFDRIDITSNSAQLIKIAVSQGRGGYDRTVGTVDINSMPAVSGLVDVNNFPIVNSAFGHVLATVTTASAQVLAANIDRRFLFVQNNNAVGTIFLRLDGGASNTTTGIHLKPGESFALNGFAPTAAIMAAGDIASNADVLIVEG